jgi:hypothetical protein
LFIASSLFDRCVSDALADEKLEKVYDFGSQCSIDLLARFEVTLRPSGSAPTHL